MNKKIIVLILIVIFFWPARVNSADQFDMVTSVGTNAKMIGIGGVEGVEQDPMVLFENPAGLYYLDNKMAISLFSETLLSEINYTNIAIGFPTQYGNFAFGIMQASVAGIPITALDPYGQFYTIGAFNYKHQILSLGHQFRLNKNLSFGSSLKYFYHDIYTVQGRGINADIGLLWQNPMWLLSLSLKNVIPNSPIKYSTGTKEDIPFQATIGAKLDLEKTKDFYVQGLEVFSQAKAISSTDLKSGPLFFSLGAKYYPALLNRIFYISGGYKQYPVVGEVRGKAEVGLGLSFLNTDFTFAFEPSDYYENTNKYFFSVGMNMDAGKVQKTEEEQEEEQAQQAKMPKFTITKEEIMAKTKEKETQETVKEIVLTQEIKKELFILKKQVEKEQEVQAEVQTAQPTAPTEPVGYLAKIMFKMQTIIQIIIDIIRKLALASIKILFELKAL